jgi:hypothetical protein
VAEVVVRVEFHLTARKTNHERNELIEEKTFATFRMLYGNILSSISTKSECDPL